MPLVEKLVEAVADAIPLLVAWRGQPLHEQGRRDAQSAATARKPSRTAVSNQLDADARPPKADG